MIDNSHPLSEMTGPSNKPTSSTKSALEQAGTIVISSELPQLSPQVSDVDEEQEPRHWNTKTKCAISCFALLAAFVGTFGTPIYIAAIQTVGEEFHVGITLAIAPASLYAYGVGIGALVGTAACEVFGRRIVYQVTIPLSLIFTIVGGSAKTFATIAVARSLSGIFAGPSLSIGAGIINDLWDVSLDKRGTAFALLYAFTNIWATNCGPMASAALITHHSWRWVFWCPAILLGITAVAAFLIPETYTPQILRSRAKRNKLFVGDQRASLDLFLTSVGRPLHMILVEPLVLPSGLVLAVTQAVVFAYYVAYAMVFEEVYGFSQFQVGMAFGALLVGTVVALPVLALFDRLTYQKARATAIQSGTTVVPETRLYPAILGVIIFPISLFWLAWTARSEIHWIAPILSGILFGLAYTLNMLCIPIYNNDVYTIHYGASVLAATTFIRFTISSSFPLFTAQMVNNLGFSWAISLLGFVAVALVPIPWVFFKWGPSLRRRSRYVKAV